MVWFGSAARLNLVIFLIINTANIYGDRIKYILIRLVKFDKQAGLSRATLGFTFFLYNCQLGKR